MKDLQSCVFRDSLTSLPALTVSNFDSYVLTDKYRLGYIDHFYNEYFEGLSHSIDTFLEIGVSGGGSLELWANYFPSSTSIYVIDIDGDCLDTPRLEQLDRERAEPIFKIAGDACSEEILTHFNDDFFDIIVDDGSHNLKSQGTVLQNFYKKLKKGGSLIIEDILSDNNMRELKLLAQSMGYSQIVPFAMSPHLKIDLFDPVRHKSYLKTLQSFVGLLHLIK